MPGLVVGLAAPSAAGPLYVTSFAGDDVLTTVLTALDLSGAVMWQRTFDKRPSSPRISDRATVWVAERYGVKLHELDADGMLVGSVEPDHEPHEHLGTFVLLPDGILVSWLPADYGHVIKPGRTPRVARYDQDGTCQWSTPVTLDHLTFPGEELDPPFAATTVHPSRWEPLLISGTRVAATFSDGPSGIEVTYFLDLLTGNIINATHPGPGGYKAIIAPGEFLIGQQGYGVFTSAHHNASGEIVQAWPTHTIPVIDRHGTIRGPESENFRPSHSRFRALNPDGTLRDGPPLSGYHTTYPALDHNGTTIFWREGALLAVDATFHMHDLFTIPDERNVNGRRTMLLDQGTIVFAIHNELLIFPNTGLGPLDTSTWPCGNGNLANNPVAHP